MIVMLMLVLEKDGNFGDNLSFAQEHWREWKARKQGDDNDWDNDDCGQNSDDNYPDWDNDDCGQNSDDNYPEAGG